MTRRQVRHRFLVLRATRWFPVGLVVPVLVLLLLDRGFSLAEIGLAAALQGVVVFALELPTGGLSDTVGRRPVLLAATATDCVAVVLLLSARSMPVLLAFWVLQGVYRALESGPLDSWFVDTSESVEVDEGSDWLERGFSAAGVVTALALASGAMIAAALVAIDPFDRLEALATPIVLAAVFKVVDFGALVALMREPPRERPVSALPKPGEVLAVIGSTTRTIRSSSILTALIAVELFWGVGLSALEGLSPPKLAATVADADQAATILGPAATCAWLAAAAGSAVAPRLAGRIGTARAAMCLLTLQAATLVAMALSTGPIGVIAFYVLAFGANGAVNPLYQSLLHRHTKAAHRTTTVSAASMASHSGGAVGMVVLGVVATTAGVETALIVAAAAVMIAVPFFRPARDTTEGRSSQPPNATSLEGAAETR